MKKWLIVLGMCGLVFLLSMSPRNAHNKSIGVEQTLEHFREHATLFAERAGELQQRILVIEANNPSSIEAAKTALKQCRLSFKNIEFFFNYFFRSLSIIYNAPAVVEVEEPFMEYREPIGLQVVAALLYSADPVSEKNNLMAQATLIYESAQDLNALLYKLPVSDSQILESIQQELISVMALGIAGFDTPELKTGITESREVFNTFQTILLPYLDGKSRYGDSISRYLKHAIKLLGENEDFDSFDRMAFITQAAIPLQRCLDRFIHERGFVLNTTGGVLDYGSGNLFSPTALRILARQPVDSAKVALGQKLFFEKALSGTRTRSCGTCHQPEKYFTDGLPKSITLDGHTTVQRNAPSLLYSAFQYSQFWDGRAKTLEAQIGEVLKNPVEMNGNHQQIIAYLDADPVYQAHFRKVFGDQQKHEVVSIANLSAAIAAYITTLAPFESAFDRYMNGDKKAMSNEQVNGFNLFMGKALCGTCHTAPLFNGLTPPLYERTTLEVVGATQDTNFNHPVLSPDKGRYDSYPLSFYKGAFKTPGLRNVAATAPYMHNGALPSLEKVLEFYNRGGGKGLGLNVPNQTLASDSLRLTAGEINNIIAFLQSLSDPLKAVNKP